MQYFDFCKYHQKTKHSYFSVRNFPNRLDWNNQPSVFKTYENFEKYELSLDKENHSFLYYIAGLSAKKIYPNVEYYLRINPSAGALYPNEIYFQSRNNKDIKDGIYHFDIRSSSITLLKAIKDEGLEKFFNLSTKVDGFLILVSSVYYRSSWKYKNRAFRYCLLDCGHILGSIEASCYLYDKDYKIDYLVEKKSLNKAFSFNKEEFFNVGIIIGQKSTKAVKEVDLSLVKFNNTQFFEENKTIQEAYNDSLNITNAQEEKAKPNFFYKKDIFKNVVFNRRSIRDFEEKTYISKEQFETIMRVLNEAITSNCDEEVQINVVINKVANMPLGIYKNNTYIKIGDFKTKAGYLCLEQDLGKDSAVTFFLTTKSKNYQEAYMKAGIIGHRLYLVSNYLGLACSGIGAYYDDEVCEFLGESSMVLYALAIGK